MHGALMIDVDGVLVKGRPADGMGWATGLETDLGLCRADLDREFFAPFWNDIVVGRAGLAECLAPVLERLAPHLSATDLIAYWFGQDSALDTALLEGISRYRAAGMRVFLATNQEHLRADYLMRQMRLGDHVDGIFYSAAMGCRKPERAFFERAGRQAGLPAKQLLLIDDTPANVAGARAAGWHAFLWQEDAALDDALAAFDQPPLA